MPDNPTVDFLRLYFCRTRWKVASCLNVCQHVACLFVWIYEGQTIISLSVIIVQVWLSKQYHTRGRHRWWCSAWEHVIECDNAFYIIVLYILVTWLWFVCLFNCFFLPPLTQTISELVETDCYQKISGFQCCRHSFPFRHPRLLLQLEKKIFCKSWDWLNFFICCMPLLPNMRPDDPTPVWTQWTTQVSVHCYTLLRTLYQLYSQFESVDQIFIYSVILFISTHRPVVQSKCSVGTSCCTKYN